MSGRWKSRTPNLAVPLGFESSCRPTQRHPPKRKGRGSNTGCVLHAGYGLASRRITALPPFRNRLTQKIDCSMTLVSPERSNATEDISGDNNRTLPTGLRFASIGVMKWDLLRLVNRCGLVFVYV